MKIMMILPGSFPPGDVERRARYAQSFCSPRTSLQLVDAKAQCALPNDFSRFNLLTTGILQRIREAQEGYDAVVVGCATDAGVESGRAISNIPVVAPTEASLHLACQLADRFGWITPADHGVPFQWRHTRAIGLAERITSIRATNIPVPDYHARKGELEEKLIQLAREMLAEGAQAIYVGCTAVFPSLGIGSAQSLTEKLGVPLVDPIAVALKTAETLVSLNLRHSRLAYPSNLF